MSMNHLRGWIFVPFFIALFLSEATPQTVPVPSPFDRGTQLFNERKFDEALSAFEEAGRLNPRDVRPHYFSALIHQARKDLSRALEEIRTARGLAPEEPIVHLRMGIILEEMGRLAEAGEAYRAALETPAGRSGEEGPPILETRKRLRALTAREHFTLAKALYGMKKYDESVQELQIVLALEPQNPVAYFALGLSLRDMEKFREAVEAFQKATEINPRYTEAYAQLGFVYERVGAYEDAIRSLEKFLELVPPDSPRAAEARETLEKSKKGLGLQKQFEKVADLMREKKWEEALEENRTLKELQPESLYVQFNFGKIYHGLTRDEEAVASLREVLEKDPKFYPARRELAIRLDEMERYPEAVAEIKAVLEITKDEEDIRKFKERLDVLEPIVQASLLAEETKGLLAREDVAGAIAEAEKLAIAKKSDPKVFIILGGLYLKAERLEDAARALKKAVDLVPRQMDPWFRLAEVYERLGRLPEAIRAYKAGAALGPRQPKTQEVLSHIRGLEIRLHFEKAKGLKDSGDMEASLREVEEILKISPDDPVVNFNAGVLNDLLDKPKEAEALLRNAVKLAPDYVQAHLQLGLFLERLGRFDEAGAAYQKVLDLQKEGGEARLAAERMENLKKVSEYAVRLRAALDFLEARDLPSALREAQEAVTIYPLNYLGYHYIGLIYQQSDRPEEAITAFRKVLEINPRFLRAYLILGRLLEEQDRMGEAQDVYQKAVAVGEGSQEAEQASTRLRSLRSWRGSFSMGHSYSTNISEGIAARPSVNSGYNASWTYSPYRARRGRVNAGIRGSGSVYYGAQLTGYGYTLFVNGDYRPREDSAYSLSLSSNKNFFESKPTSKNLSYSAGLTLTPRTIPTSLGFQYSASVIRSFQNKASDADKQSIGVSFRQDLGILNSVSGGFTYAIQPNTDPLGSNRGNRTQQLSFSYSRRFPPSISLNMSYNIGLVQYMNPDSTTFFRQYRRNINQGGSLGLSLPLSAQVSFSAGYAFSTSQTNLPRPTAELQQTLEEILSTPIPTVGGGGASHTVTLNFGVNF